ncbi:MAG: sugar kinase [Chloroflexi bacterium]|nr:sugar kinase [Chloroflexota bacterium]
MKPEVVTLGECLVALVADRPGALADISLFEAQVAGAEANVAVGLARLGHRSAFIGGVGGDGFGTAIIRRLRGEGVDTSTITVDAGTTGLLVRERRTFGPTEVVYYRTDSAGSHLGADDVRAAADHFAGSRWLHLTGITPALSPSCAGAVNAAIDLAREHGLTISLDLNLRRKLWRETQAAETLRALCGRADVVLAGLDEAALVAGLDAGTSAEEVGGALASLDVATVIVKQGSRGALQVVRGQDPVERPAPQVPVPVDHVGAGDAFAAGYIAARLEGLEAGRALELGNACGASVVAAVGDMAGLPTRAEVDRIIGAAAQDPIR